MEDPFGSFDYVFMMSRGIYDEEDALIGIMGIQYTIDFIQKMVVSGLNDKFEGQYIICNSKNEIISKSEDSADEFTSERLEEILNLAEPKSYEFAEGQEICWYSELKFDDIPI